MTKRIRIVLAATTVAMLALQFAAFAGPTAYN